MYEYSARVVKVLDGDTIDVDVDLGLHVHTRTRIRLWGLNAPEHGTTAGDNATGYLRHLLPVDTSLLLHTLRDKTEKYGRWLGVLWLDTSDGQVNLNEQLVALGHAKAWDGHGARPV